jgi:hypothetical protein
VKASLFSITGIAILLTLSGLGGSILSIDKSHMAYAHTFSTTESAQFLSLTEQIKAETDLVVMNLEDNNAALAQAHAEKAGSLLNNWTIDEIRERNNRIANSLETSLAQLEQNVSPTASQGQIQDDRVQSINQTVVSLNNVLAEAVTVRVESEQQENATTWAMVLANLTNVVLSDYGNATGAPFDLTNMSSMEDHQMNQSSNMTMDHGGMSMQDNDTMTMSNGTSMENATTIVDAAAYQSAQYLANNTILQLFNDTLKPITISANDTSAGNNSMTTGNTTSIDELEASLLELRDNINNKASAHEVMATVHTKIHPLMIQLYGLTIEHEEGEEDSHEEMDH